MYVCCLSVWRLRSCARSMRRCRRTCMQPRASRTGRPTAETPSTSELSWTAAASSTNSWRETNSIEQSESERWWPSDITHKYTHSLHAHTAHTHTQQSGWVIYNSKRMLYIQQPVSYRNILRGQSWTQTQSIVVYYIIIILHYIFTWKEYHFVQKLGIRETNLVMWPMKETKSLYTYSMTRMNMQKKLFMNLTQH